MKLEGRVAVVMGAGQSPGIGVGNGRATALVFARQGAKVVAVDRDSASAAETVAMIEAKGGTAMAVTADVTDEAAVQAAIQAGHDKWQRIDILHNNVGIGTGDASPHKIEIEAWDRVLAVNLKSAVVPCKHVVPVMREQRAGSIVTISSIAAICATPTVAYKTSKAGLNAYNQTLAMSNAKYGIRANVIMPGLMNTPMIVEPLKDSYGDGGVEEMIRVRDAQCPMGHMGDAWDVANAALFLASDESRITTGHILTVDSGTTIS